MKIRSVKANNRRKAFEVMAAGKRLLFPYAQLLAVRPTAEDPIAHVSVDRELGAEGFTYALRSGQEGTVHVEDVLEYNQDLDYLRDLLLYRLTLEAQKRIAASPSARSSVGLEPPRRSSCERARPPARAFDHEGAAPPGAPRRGPALPRARPGAADLSEGRTDGGLLLLPPRPRHPGLLAR